MPKALRSRLSFALVLPAVYQGNVLNFQSSSWFPSFVLFLLVNLQRLIAFTALINSVRWGEHKLHIALAHVGMDKAALACWCLTPSSWRFTFPPFRYPPSQIIALEIRFWIYNNLQPKWMYLLQGLSSWSPPQRAFHSLLTPSLRQMRSNCCCCAAAVAKPSGGCQANRHQTNGQDVHSPSEGYARCLGGVQREASWLRRQS